MFIDWPQSLMLIVYITDITSRAEKQTIISAIVAETVPKAAKHGVAHGVVGRAPNDEAQSAYGRLGGESYHGRDCARDKVHQWHLEHGSEGRHQGRR